MYAAFSHLTLLENARFLFIGHSGIYRKVKHPGRNFYYIFTIT